MDVAPAAGRTHRARAWVAVVAVAVVGCTDTACTSPAALPTARRTVTDVRTLTGTRTAGPSDGGTAPLSSGPTGAATAPSCPWLEQQAAADRVGMRLGRITVLHSGGDVVGCRFYALQDSPLHRSEHLPGPRQPAIEIITTRYPSALAAHNAFVRIARGGQNIQRAAISRGALGLCFQTEFDQRDHGHDWACTTNVGEMLLEVRTVVVSPALNVVEVSRRVAEAIRKTR
jgi:hypothetical protein